MPPWTKEMRLDSTREWRKKGGAALAEAVEYHEQLEDLSARLAHALLTRASATIAISVSNATETLTPGKIAVNGSYDRCNVSAEGYLPETMHEFPKRTRARPGAVAETEKAEYQRLYQQMRRDKQAFASTERHERITRLEPLFDAVLAKLSLSRQQATSFAPTTATISLNDFSDDLRRSLLQSLPFTIEADVNGAEQASYVEQGTRDAASSVDSRARPTLAAPGEAGTQPGIEGDSYENCDFDWDVDADPAGVVTVPSLEDATSRHSRGNGNKWRPYDPIARRSR